MLVAARMHGRQEGMQANSRHNLQEPYQQSCSGSPRKGRLDLDQGITLHAQSGKPHQAHDGRAD
jgi:hypothetical protein